MANQVQTQKDDAFRELIQAAEAGFLEVVKAAGNKVIFQQESLFAMKSLLENEMLARTAVNNPTSFKLALVHIASAGLTLNPAMGLAYLVPRGGRVIADISYRGLIKIATDSRAVNLVVAETVYSNDVFRYQGSGVDPIHHFDPFMAVSERGEFRGVYVKAHLAIGCMLVTCLSAEEIYAARNMSSSWVNGSIGKKGPWESHFRAMALKTAIKSARKFWPMTSPVLDQVISYLNEEAGEGFEGSPITLDVAAKELGVPQLQHEQSLVMPVMPVVGQGVYEGAVMESRAEVTQKVKRAEIPTPEPVSDFAKTPQNITSDNIDPKVVERIEKVLVRTQRLGSWTAAYDWVSANLKGAEHQYAMKKLTEAEALKKAS